MTPAYRLVHPSYYFYQIKFPSELQFSQDKLNRDLISFADTCSNKLAGLAAVINTDMYHNFPEQKEFYYAFGENLKAKNNNHSYTKDYYRKLRYYDLESTDAPKGIWKYVVWLLGISTIFLLWQNLNLRKNRTTPSDDIRAVKPEISLTSQEQKILDLIVDGKSNKEIAAELFIGLSTVKNHINKLYSKIGVKDRKEAINHSKSMSTSRV